MTDFDRASVIECLALGYDVAMIAGRAVRIIGATRTGPLCKVHNPGTGRTEIRLFKFAEIDDIKHWKEAAA